MCLRAITVLLLLMAIFSAQPFETCTLRTIHLWMEAVATNWGLLAVVQIVARILSVEPRLCICLGPSQNERCKNATVRPTRG
jgi:hypothetical protein